jgi:hypothetical protein
MSHVWFPPCCRPLVAMSITSTTLPWLSSQRYSTLLAYDTPAGDEASLAGSDIQLSLSAVASRSSGKTSAHRVVALPHWRAAGGLALPRWLREGEGGLGRGKAQSCSSAWSARTPTL